MSDPNPYLETQAFSSEDGSWGGYTKIRTPYLHGCKFLFRRARPLVAGGAAHWLCVTESRIFVLKLQMRAAQAAVRVTMLPKSFPRPNAVIGTQTHYLLATSVAAGEELPVLVADTVKISCWVQTKPTGKWERRPQVVVYPHHEAMLRFRAKLQLHWFAERSGLVLFSCDGYGDFWLDHRSMKIVRWFPGDPPGVTRFPYEMDLSSWVPTFTSSIVLKC